MINDERDLLTLFVSSLIRSRGMNGSYAVPASRYNDPELYRTKAVLYTREGEDRDGHRGFILQLHDRTSAPPMDRTARKLDRFLVVAVEASDNELHFLSPNVASGQDVVSLEAVGYQVIARLKGATRLDS